MTLPIPRAALAQHLVALGKTGSGKSSKLRVIVEHLLEGETPVCIIDPKGDWWGLKSSADGKRSGFPLVIFGGEHADVPINEHSGAHVAELVATGNRSCLIDLGGWMVGERTRFFIAYASTLFKLARGARHQVIDEVHNFAPQGKILDPDAGRMLHWTNRLASEGRGKGITLIAASQRPQKVHKDFLTSCETLIACKVIHKLDRDAIKDWIDGCADPARGREVIASLAQLKKPEAWVWSPEIDFGPELVTFPMFKTYDSFKPQAADAGKLKGWAEVDLEEVKTKLATVVEQAKANDPRELKARIAELERDLRSVKGSKAGTSDDELRTAIAAAEERGFARGLSYGQNLANNIRVVLLRMVDTNDTMISCMESIKTQINGDDPGAKFVYQGPVVQNPRRIPHPSPPRATPATRNGEGPNDGGSSVDKPMPRAMLTALAQHQNGLTKSQILVHTGYRSSGPVSKCFAELARSGWISSAGNLVLITDAGLRALGAFDPLPTGEAMRELLLTGTMCSTMEKAMLGVLFAEYPNAVAKGEILKRTNYASSGPVSKAFGHLVAIGYAVQSGAGQLRAAEELFE